jgi:hypothetical protein
MVKVLQGVVVYWHSLVWHGGEQQRQRPAWFSEVMATYSNVLQKQRKVLSSNGIVWQRYARCRQSEAPSSNGKAKRRSVTVG